MTLEEAKALVRRTAADAGLLSWVRAHPLEAAASAFALGLLSGSGRETRRTASSLLALLFRIL